MERERKNSQTEVEGTLVLLCRRWWACKEDKVMTTEIGGKLEE